MLDRHPNARLGVDRAPRTQAFDDPAVRRAFFAKENVICERSSFAQAGAEETGADLSAKFELLWTGSKSFPIGVAPVGSPPSGRSTTAGNRSDPHRVDATLGWGRRLRFVRRGKKCTASTPIPSVWVDSASDGRPGARPPAPHQRHRSTTLTWSEVADKSAALALTDSTCRRPNAKAQPSRPFARCEHEQIGRPVTALRRGDAVENQGVKYCYYFGRGCARVQAGLCPYEHDEAINGTERTRMYHTMREAMRRTVCRDGRECSDGECLFGHRCPFPLGNEGDGCIYGSTCRFSPQLHRASSSRHLRVQLVSRS